MRYNHISKIIIAILIMITLLTITPASASTQQAILNGDFSYSNVNLYGWSYYPDPVTTDAYANIAYDSGKGSYCAHLYATSKAYSGKESYSNIYQYVDLTGVDTITLKIKQGSDSVNSQFDIRIGSTVIATYNIGTSLYKSWTTISVDVSEYDGTWNVHFEPYCKSQTSTNYVADVYIDDISAIRTIVDPAKINSITDETNVNTLVEQGNSHTYKVYYDQWSTNPTAAGQSKVALGVRLSGTTISTQYVDLYSGQTYTDSGGQYVKFTVEYSSTGAYELVAYGKTTTDISYTVTKSITSVSTVISGNGETNTIYGSLTGGTYGVMFESTVQGSNPTYLWNFGDNTATSNLQSPLHYYTSNGQYTATCTMTFGSAGSISKTLTIIIGDNYIRFDKTTYTQGETATISWNILTMPSGVWQIDIESYDYGNSVGGNFPITINSQSGTVTWNTADVSGRYYARITKDSQAIQELTSATVTIQAMHTLTITTSINGVSYTGDSTITISQSGTTVKTLTPIGGTVSTQLVDGGYSVTAATTGYNEVSTNIQLTSDWTINLDFVTGSSSGGSNPSGSGGSYASTFTTIYILANPYGTALEGVSVSGYAVSSSAASWIGDLFGQIWGSKVVGSTVSDSTDWEGKVTFPVFPSVKYYMTITDSRGRLKQDYTFSFTPSSLTTPYLYYVDLVDQPDKYSLNDISTSVLVNNTNGEIKIAYVDGTGEYRASPAASGVTFKAYVKSDDSWDEIPGIYASSNNTALSSTFQLTGYTGNEYKFVFKVYSTVFEPFERIYYKTFPGPRIKVLNLPDSLYIWICFITALLMGGVATYLSSAPTCLLICFVEWVYWFFGWFFAVDEMIPGISVVVLTFATVMSVAYYIATRK